MAAVGTFRSGKGSRMKVGTNSYLKGKRWSVKESGGVLDTTNFECFTTTYGSSGSGGGRAFTQQLIGNETANGSYSGAWDAGQNSFDDPPGIYTRDDGPAMLLILNRTDANYYNFLATVITAPSIDCDQAGLLNFAFEFQNQGPYARPTGSFA